MSDRYAFPATVELDESGFYLVLAPDVPEMGTDDRDYATALVEGQDALICALGGYVLDRRPIPKPSTPAPGQPVIALPPLVAAKLALHERMLELGITNSALAERLSVTEKAARRLVDLDYRSHIGDVGAALLALGRRLTFEFAEIA